MHQGGRPSRSHAMHQAAGREYRLFRARTLRPGNERGCVEPPELERSPQLVTAGRNVRRWCLHPVVRPAIAHAIPCHPEHREGSPPTSSHPHSIPLHPTSVPTPPRHNSTTIPPPSLLLTTHAHPLPTLPILRCTPFLHIIDFQPLPILLRGKFPKAKSEHTRHQPLTKTACQ